MLSVGNDHPARCGSPEAEWPPAPFLYAGHDSRLMGLKASGYRTKGTPSQKQLRSKRLRAGSWRQGDRHDEEEPNRRPKPVGPGSNTLGSPELVRRPARPIRRNRCCGLRGQTAPVESGHATARTVAAVHRGMGQWSCLSGRTSSFCFVWCPGGQMASGCSMFIGLTDCGLRALATISLLCDSAIRRWGKPSGAAASSCFLLLPGPSCAKFCPSELDEGSASVYPRCQQQQPNVRDPQVSHTRFGA